MPDAAESRLASIAESVLLARLDQSEQMRAFFIQMWLENPSLAAGAGQRVHQILSPAGDAPADDPILLGSPDLR